LFAFTRPLACTVAAVAVLSAAAASAQTPYLQVPSWEPKYTAIVMDARSGEVLYTQRADSPRYPASITKIMTLYLAFGEMASGRLHASDMLVVSPHAAAQAPSKLGLRAGETISVEDAMHAIAVKSANDMAVALAERIGGTESRFAEMMTLKAGQLGMSNSQFVNANGLPDSRQISTARDIAILSRAVIRDFPQYYGYFSQEQFTFRGQTMTNHNGLLGHMPGVDGLKTGFTNAAGFNLSASAMRNGHRLIAVVMGGSSRSARNANVEGLLLTGFDIEERRDHGERIQVTQNLFGTAPDVSYAANGRAMTEEGDDTDPIDAVLSHAGARPGPVMASIPMFAPRASAPKPTVGRWWVQVGEFRSRDAARSQIETISRQFARLFDNAEGSVNGAGKGYRAVFSGLSEPAARDACAAMKTRSIPCIAGG
jgi:D-alanyl-D-alanine carboxypeptidase (penicillin-binding protein 5/6)